MGVEGCGQFERGMRKSPASPCPRVSEHSLGLSCAGCIEAMRSVTRALCLQLVLPLEGKI